MKRILVLTPADEMAYQMVFHALKKILYSDGYELIWGDGANYRFHNRSPVEDMYPTDVEAVVVFYGDYQSEGSSIDVVEEILGMTQKHLAGIPMIFVVAGHFMLNDLKGLMGRDPKPFISMLDVSDAELEAWPMITNAINKLFTPNKA